MDEEILEKKPSNPTESAMLVLIFLFLVGSIMMSRVEVGEYLHGTSDSDWQLDVKKRISSKYKNDTELQREIRKIPKERKKFHGFITDSEASDSAE